MKLADLRKKQEKMSSSNARTGHTLRDRLGKTPEIWDGDFTCSEFELTSLEGAPHNVDGCFDCSNNKLTSLKGAPVSIESYFDCCNNQLTSLKDVHKHVKVMHGTFHASGNPIRSHVLGLLYIKGCTRVTLTVPDYVEAILNRYLELEDRDHATIIKCQSELLDAGLEEYAQL